MIQKNQAKQIKDNLGVSILPCTNKRPNLSWKDFQSRIRNGQAFPIGAGSNNYRIYIR